MQTLVLEGETLFQFKHYIVWSRDTIAWIRDIFSVRTLNSSSYCYMMNAKIDKWTIDEKTDGFVFNTMDVMRVST